MVDPNNNSGNVYFYSLLLAVVTLTLLVTACCIEPQIFLIQQTEMPSVSETPLSFDI